MPKSSSKSGITKRHGPGLRMAPNSRSTSATPVSFPLEVRRLEPRPRPRAHAGGQRDRRRHQRAGDDRAGGHRCRVTFPRASVRFLVLVDAWPPCGRLARRLAAPSWRACAPRRAPAAAFARPADRGRRPRCCCLRGRSRTPRNNAGDSRSRTPGAPLSMPPAASAAAWNASTRRRLERKAMCIGRSGLSVTVIHRSGLPRLAQPGGARKFHRDRVADRGERRLVEGQRARQILNVQADVVEHAGRIP